MRLQSIVAVFGIVSLGFIGDVLGNGRMLVPPQRSSLWRDPAFYRNRHVFKNYDDHTLNCGGFWVSNCCCCFWWLTRTNSAGAVVNINVDIPFSCHDNTHIITLCKVTHTCTHACTF